MHNDDDDGDFQHVDKSGFFRKSSSENTEFSPLRDSAYSEEDEAVRSQQQQAFMTQLRTIVPGCSVSMLEQVQDEYGTYDKFIMRDVPRESRRRVESACRAMVSEEDWDAHNGVEWNEDQGTIYVPWTRYWEMRNTLFFRIARAPRRLFGILFFAGLVSCTAYGAYMLMPGTAAAF
jgi:hypothetical protein